MFRALTSLLGLEELWFLLVLLLPYMARGKTPGLLCGRPEALDEVACLIYKIPKHVS